MDLKDFLQTVFPNKDEEKYKRMIDNLKRLGVDYASDLMYLDEEAIKELESFNRIEIRTLRDHLAKGDFETLVELLGKIFAGTPADRIKEIERFLNENKMFVRKDVLVIDIKKLKTRDFFQRVN